MTPQDPGTSDGSRRRDPSTVVAGAPPAGLEWQQVHPITPLVRGWAFVAALLVVAFSQISQNVSGAGEVAHEVGWGPVALVLVVVVLGAFGYSALAWRVTRYAIDDETVYHVSGVVFRRQRAARIDRIQGIDVIKPLLARVVGLSELKIEVAGGQDSAVRLAFLRDAEAERLRNELLARAAGLHVPTRGAAAGAASGAGATAEGGGAESLSGDGPVTVLPAPATAAPERELVAVPPGRIVRSLLRSGGTLVTAVFLVGVVVLLVAVREPAVVFSMLPGLLGAGGALWNRFTSEYGFRLAQSPDGIRLHHGLLEVRAQTVPPGRVQAVRVSQSVFWRSQDWWRVEVNVAGYVQQAKEPSQTVLLPVGTREEALLALWLVLPDLGVDDVQGTLDAALTGTGPEGGFVTSPRSSRWFDPFAWRRNGYLVTERALLARRGWLLRRLLVVPHERTQSIALRQGPLQRALGLATVGLHSTPGPVHPRVPHLAEAVAGELVTTQARRAREARAAAGPERWMEALAIDVPEPAVEPETDVDVAQAAGAWSPRLEDVPEPVEWPVVAVPREPAPDVAAEPAGEPTSGTDPDGPPPPTGPTTWYPQVPKPRVNPSRPRPDGGTSR